MAKLLLVFWADTVLCVWIWMNSCLFPCRVGYQVSSDTTCASMKRWFHWGTTLVLRPLWGWMSTLWNRSRSGYKSWRGHQGWHGGWMLPDPGWGRGAFQSECWFVDISWSDLLMILFTLTCTIINLLYFVQASYKCQHRVNPRAAKSSKNTCCQAKMHTTLKSTRGEIKWVYWSTYLLFHLWLFLHNIGLCYRTKTRTRLTCLKVILINRHNHNLFVADAIRHRDVGLQANSPLTGPHSNVCTGGPETSKRSMGSDTCTCRPTGTFAPTCLMYRGGYHIWKHGQDTYYPLYK